MDNNVPEESGSNWTANILHHMEHAVYVTIGGLLVLALVLALAGAGQVRFEGVKDWSGTTATFDIVD